MVHETWWQVGRAESVIVRPIMDKMLCSTVTNTNEVTAPRTSITHPLTISWIIPKSLVYNHLTLYDGIGPRLNDSMPNDWDLLDWLLLSDCDLDFGWNNVGQISLNDRKESIIPGPFHSVPAHSYSAHSVPAHSYSAHSVPAHSYSAHSVPAHSLPTHSVPTNSVPAHSAPTHSAPAHSVPTHSVPAHSYAPQSPNNNTHYNNQKPLGNVALSSCPGKKVRLHSGPIQGKAMVSRDLNLDFTRLKSLGIQLIVNCLSDIELVQLGAPIKEYLSAAKQHSIRVLRLPMLEGSVPILNDLLYIMEQMLITTKSGISVLVHCRGGIGRAGIVASCWLVYANLVSIPKQPSCPLPPFYSHIEASKLPNASSPIVPLQHAQVKDYFPPQDGLLETKESTAKRAIRVVRLRRSHKAIETKEQEEFVERFAKMIATTNIS
jgi:protein-tyrosine phosphatase